MRKAFYFIIVFIILIVLSPTLLSLCDSKNKQNTKDNVNNDTVVLARNENKQQEKNTVSNQNVKQNLPKAEKELRNIYQKDLELSKHSHEIVFTFGDTLTKLLLSDTSTMSYPFKQIVDRGYGNGYVKISTSKDGNLRFYSWETPFGGTMFDYGNVYQYKSNGTVYTIKGTPFDIEDTTKFNYGTEHSYGTVFESIYPVIVNGKTCYIVEYGNRIGTGDYMNYITAFIIENDQLKTTAIFKTPKGYSSDFSYEWCRCESELGFSYDKAKKILIVPDYKDNYFYECKISRYAQYQLRGDYFEFIGYLGSQY